MAAKPFAHPFAPGDIANLVMSGLTCVLLITLISLIIPLPHDPGNSWPSGAERQPLLFAERSMANIPNDHSENESRAYGSTRTLNHDDRCTMDAEINGSEAQQGSGTGGMQQIVDSIAVS